MPQFTPRVPMPWPWFGGLWGDHWRVSTSPQEADRLKVPRALVDRFIDVLCDAASLDKVKLRRYLVGDL
jgi:hypothetical protein